MTAPPDLSLNEVDAMARRAARGAGYPWGLAEEAGKAARWLCARSLDGCKRLAGVLDAGFAADLPAHMPADPGAPWQGAGPLCPLATGAAVSDMAARLADQSLTLHEVAHPMLLVPFAGLAALRAQTPVCVDCGDDGGRAVTDGLGLSLDGPFPALARIVTIRRGGDLHNPLAARTRAAPDPAAWALLGRLAGRTYAPATEESRRLGAGAGLSDND